MQEPAKRQGFPRSFWTSLISFFASVILTPICGLFIIRFAARGLEGTARLILFGPPLAAVVLGLISIYFGVKGLKRTKVPLIWVIPSAFITASLSFALAHDIRGLGDPVQAVKRTPAVAYCVSTNAGGSRYFIVRDVWKGGSDPRLSVSVGQRLSLPIPSDANPDGVIALFSSTSIFGRGPLHASDCMAVYGGRVPVADGLPLDEFRSKCGF